MAGERISEPARILSDEKAAKAAKAVSRHYKMPRRQRGITVDGGKLMLTADGVEIIPDA